jgi:hypothetical protein
MHDLLALYASIGLFAGLAQLAYLGVAFGVGSLLLVRGRRAGEWTQWVLGLHLLLSMGIGYVLTSVGVTSVEFGAPLPDGWLPWTVGGGYASSALGLCLTLDFTRRVFRPGHPGALCIAFACGTAIWAGWLGYALCGGIFHGRFVGGWYWLMTGGMIATNLWVAFEPLLYFSRLRKRVRLGLAEPVVANRMLLWGIGSVARAVLAPMGPIGSSYMAGLDESARLSAGAVVLVVTSALGLTTGVAYWLTFQPPRAYLRWVEARADKGAA